MAPAGPWHRKKVTEIRSRRPGLERALVLCVAASRGAVADKLVITNIADEDPESDILLNRLSNKPVEFWQGNYSDLTTLACNRSGDLLFDWLEMKWGMVSWLKEMMRGTDRVAQTYWEAIRPVQHAFTNIIAFHNITTTRDCLLGMLSVRLFYMTVQSQSYREVGMVEQNNFMTDWHYYSHKLSWAKLARSGWGNVLWPCLHLLSVAFRRHMPSLAWADCDQLPGGAHLISAGQDVMLTVQPTVNLAALMRILDEVDVQTVRQCPVAHAYAAAVVAMMADDVKVSLRYFDRAQTFVKQYREINDFTFVNLLNVHWPLWQTMAFAMERVSHQLGMDIMPRSCGLLYCPDGGTPNPLTCKCQVLFPRDHPKVTACFFMVDTRPKSSLRNITSLLNARFWTLTYGINRAYADEHSYEIEYVQPDNQTHFPDRKVGWGKVKVMIDRLREYGPDRCAYGVSIDSDAYMRTSEPLAAAVHFYGLDEAKLILFSQEYHTELRPDSTFINGGFFIVRNVAAGVRLLEEWYNVPNDYSDMSHLKKEDPQGLNLCWDLKIHPRHADSVVLAPSYLFTAPLGWFVRHNWFKDLRFEQEMQDVLLQRLQRRYGCIVCQNVYEWDASLNTDPGWR